MKFRSQGLIFTGVVAWLGGAVPFGGMAFAQTVPKAQMADDVFKNIQVLKGLTVDEFMGTMGLFSAALNVCCGDCHVGAGGSDPKWDADDKPEKKIARQMVTMMNNINKQNFGGGQRVTCWTCHRGSEHPSSTPPLESIYGDPVLLPPDVLAVAPADRVPTVDAIFDKYIQALGGADKLAALKTWTAKATSHLFGETNEDPAEIYAKAPNLLATVVHQREGDLARTYDGKEAWVVLPLTVTKEYELHGGLLEGGKLDAQMAFPLGLKGFFKTWHVGFPTTLEGKDVYVIQGTNGPGLLATFYFDRKTGMLLRMMRAATSAVGRVPTQIDYLEYRPVAGVMLPFKWNYGWVSGREEYTVQEIQPNVPVDASKFIRPKVK